MDRIPLSSFCVDVMCDTEKEAIAVYNQLEKRGVLGLDRFENSGLYYVRQYVRTLSCLGPKPEGEVVALVTLNEAIAGQSAWVPLGEESECGDNC